MLHKDEEGEERQQEIESLHEEIMAENSLNLVKEKDTQSRKLRESQTRWTQRNPHQKNIIKMSKVKDKEKILKAASYLQRSTNFSTETFHTEGIGVKYSKWHKARTYKQDYSTKQGYHSRLKVKERPSQTRKG